MPCNGNSRVENLNGQFRYSIPRPTTPFLSDKCCTPFVIGGKLKYKLEFCKTCWWVPAGPNGETFAVPQPPNCEVFSTRTSTFGVFSFPNGDPCNPCDIIPAGCAQIQCFEFGDLNCQPIEPPTSVYTQSFVPQPCTTIPDPLPFGWASLPPFSNGGYPDSGTNCCKVVELDGFDLVNGEWDDIGTIFCPSGYTATFSGQPEECDLEVVTVDDFINGTTGLAVTTSNYNGASKSKQSYEFQILHGVPPSCDGYLKIWTRREVEQLRRTSGCGLSFTGDISYSNYNEYEFTSENVCADLSGEQLFTAFSEEIAAEENTAVKIEWKFSLKRDCEPPWRDNFIFEQGYTTPNCIDLR
jgi:hypothetical protein